MERISPCYMILHVRKDESSHVQSELNEDISAVNLALGQTARSDEEKSVVSLFFHPPFRGSDNLI